MFFILSIKNYAKCISITCFKKHCGQIPSLQCFFLSQASTWIWKKLHSCIEIGHLNNAKLMKSHSLFGLQSLSSREFVLHNRFCRRFAWIACIPESRKCLKMKISLRCSKKAFSQMITYFGCLLCCRSCLFWCRSCLFRVGILILESPSSQTVKYFFSIFFQTIDSNENLLRNPNNI